MESHSETPPALKNVFGISYAILRFSPTLKNKALASHLDGYALRIVEEVAVENYEQAARTAKGMEFLARLAGSTGMMKFENSQILIAELHKLLRSIVGIENGGEADMEVLIRESNEDTDKIKRSGNEGKDRTKRSGNVSGNERQVIRQQQLPHEEKIAEEVAKKADPTQEVRQTAILNRIRQFGNCRVKDFQDILPNVSERTIRYDLQRLAEQGIVDRIGAGGPFSHYRLRTDVLPRGAVFPEPIPNASPVSRPTTPGVS